MYPNIFDATTLEENKARLDKLTSETQPLWGKMNVAQMLAHLNVAYDLPRKKIAIKVSFMMRFFLKIFVKKMVVGDKPYTKNGRTAPYFLITEQKDFNEQKALLLENMKWVYDKGEGYWDGRDSGSFGPLTIKERSNLYQKHLDHHFQQFGV